MSSYIGRFYLPKTRNPSRPRGFLFDPTEKSDRLREKIYYLPNTPTLLPVESNSIDNNLYNLLLPSHCMSTIWICNGKEARGATDNPRRPNGFRMAVAPQTEHPQVG